MYVIFKHMTLSAIFPLLSALVVLVLAIIVFSFGKKSTERTTFLFFIFFTFIWMTGTFMMFLSKGDVDAVVFWDRFVYMGVVFIPVSMLHFGFSLIDRRDRLARLMIFFGYILSSVFFLLIHNKYFLYDAYFFAWGAHSKASVMHDIFLIYFAIYILMWFVFLVKYFLSIRQSIEKEKIKYSLIAFVQFALFGPLGFLPAYGIDIYPASYISGLVFTVIITYAMVSYRLMDIRLVFRQSTVFLSSLFATVIPVFTLRYLVELYLPTALYWPEVVMLVIAASLFPVLKEKFSRFANRYLFTSLYDSKFVIRELTTALSATLETKRIYQSVTDSLVDALHSKSISFWQHVPEKNNYVLDFNKGLSLKNQFKIRASKNIFNNYFIFSKAVSIEELKSGPLKNLAFIKDFSAAGIEVIVTLLIKDKLIGLICFGPKLSGDIYNNEDFDLLHVISAQVAIALENAFLYEETKQFNLKLSDEIDKATKDLRAANEELKNLDRAKSEFISIASHQLRTPLTVIKGYGSMMLEGSFGAMTPAINENIKKIYDSNERLIALVEDLLNISRIESGKLQFNFEACQLEDIISSVVEELTVPAANKGLKLIWQTPAEKLPAVNIDKGKIRQVAINIIDNAIKYTPKGSIEVNLKLDGDQILFSSVDTGLGISHDDLVNLFKKFSRGEHVSLLHTEGTGLGLYVGKMMIEAHKGRIWAESAGIDNGSQFYFTLPIAK